MTTHPIRRLATLTLAFGLLAHCHEGTDASRQASASTDGERRPLHFPSELAESNFRELMRQKAELSDAMLRDLLYGDLIGVARRAGELREIGRRAEVEVGTTPQYATYAEAFQATLGEIAERARARDVSGVLDTHARMNRTCLQCHAYLRSAEDW